MIGILLIIIVLLIFLPLFFFFKRRHNYWKNLNVIYPEPVPVLGNYGDYILLKKDLAGVSKEICEQYPEAPYIGTFFGTEPALLVQSPELLRIVTTKDFYYFSGREISDHTHKEIFTQNLFFTYGDRWKVIRQNLTPLFSSAKMKNMFHLIEKCSYVFEDLIDEETRVSDVLEARSLMARFTMDCIAACAFGVDSNAMGKDITNNPFRRMGDLVFEVSKLRGLALVTRAMWPTIFYGLGFKVFPDALNDFFQKLIVGVFKARHYEPSPRNDFIDLMLSMDKSKCWTGDSIHNAKTGTANKFSMESNDELLASQSSLFFAAGYETSATTLGFTLYELAKNQEAQTRAAAEVDQYLIAEGGTVKHSCVTTLPWLNACIDEALRLHPVLGHLAREMFDDYELPDGCKLRKGLRVHIPVLRLHMNPDNFPEPTEYRPDRFMPGNQQNIKPYSYMPFGEGPRICIGMRFAKMQMMAGLVTLLKKYRVELAPNMPKDLVLEPKLLVRQAVGGIKLKFTPREGWEKRMFKKDISA